jgi:Tfp pilus assembly protein FimT
VELIVVVVILAIAAAAVVPYAVGTSSMSCQAAARRLMADLEYAQNQAIVTQSATKVTFDSSANSYTVANQSGTLIHPITKKDYIVDFDTEDTFKGITISSLAFGSEDEVSFSALGAPSQGGSVDLAAGSHSYRVTVAPVTGRVSVSELP